MRTFPIFLALTLATTACAGDPPTPPPFTVSGTFAIPPRPGGWDGAAGARCENGSSGGFSDINEGAQVVVSDASAKTLAIGKLGAGQQDGVGGCQFTFTVTGVPAGHQFYGVEVTHRGRLQYSAADIAKPLTLTLGG